MGLAEAAGVGDLAEEEAAAEARVVADRRVVVEDTPQVAAAAAEVPRPLAGARRLVAVVVARTDTKAARVGLMALCFAFY